MDEKKRAIVYRPAAPEGIKVLVKIYPAEFMETLGVDQWLLNKLTRSKSPKGSWSGEPKVVRQSANIASGSRQLVTKSGLNGALEAFAFSADRQYVRLAVVIYTREEKNKNHTAQAWKILGDVVGMEKADAREQNRGFDLERSPPKIEGIKTGNIPIKPGRYVGASTRKGRVINRYQVMLYANGEYEFLDSDDRGHYVYSNVSGRLDLEDEFYNSTYRPHEEFCIYGIDQKSDKPTIYAEEGAMSRYRYRLVWTSPPDRLSPSERKSVEKVAQEEAKRYRFVVNPGDGIREEQIEAVLYTSDISYGVTNKLDASAYVLMKDGRVMDGMPVAPDMLDVAKSRSREPDRWGWWKYNGENYRFAWDVDRKNFVIPKGSQTVARPIPSGTRLEGSWQASSSFSASNASITSFWGVRLDKQGRFEKFSRSLSQSGGEVSGGLGPLVTTMADDEGAVTSVIGSNIGGGTSTKYNNPKSDRNGWYEFDGYNLTLKFDNGKIKRLLTFTTDEKTRVIWFEGGSLSRDK
ncbi:MAG: hypothetical protein ABW080_12850 [Candidatus Thiodiazotropha sp.]